MQIDNTTYSDLSVFQTADEFSLFSKLDRTKTSGGRMQLLQFFKNPYSQLDKIIQTQEILRVIGKNESLWGPSISNGTIMVLERYYETPLDQLPASHDPLSAGIYRIFHTADFSLTRYSLFHFADFIKGLLAITSVRGDQSLPPLLRSCFDRIKILLSPPILHALSEKKTGAVLSTPEVVKFGAYIRNHFKPAALELIDIYGKLDAWYAMSVASRDFNLVEPEFLETENPLVKIRGLYHLLVQQPVAYDVEMDPESNFIFLTGANMAGKSTFIKSVGSAIFLAHLGMGVPAKKMELSIFDGILSNINVVDNLVKGESYFFNEVQRIRNTILQINNKKKWLVLIDELFKGTNVQDAMKCSTTVIHGLLKIKSSLFILSTHLYEIGEELKRFPNISFKYFETGIREGQLIFPYLLKEGISNDRLGYLILEKEKVVELLDNL